MSKNIYESPTLIGNWKEKHQIDKEREKIILQKIQNEELLIQKAGNLYLDFNKEVNLSFGSSDYLSIGDTVQICHNLHQSPSYCLSVSPTSEILYCTAAPNSRHFSVCLTENEKSPTTKTAFTICPVPSRSSSNKWPLRYGDNFLLCVNILGKKMYLCCRSSTSGGITNCDPSDVFLSEIPSQYATWNLKHTNPEWRLEHDGCKVSIKEYFILNNTFTNQSLVLKYSANRLLDKSTELQVTVSAEKHNFTTWKFITVENMRKNQKETDFS